MSYICPDCVGEPVLQSIVIAEASAENPCEYCESDLPTAAIWSIAERCDKALDTFYEDSSRAMAVVLYDRTPAGEDLSTTIQGLARVPESAASDIIDALQEIGTTGILVKANTAMTSHGSSYALRSSHRYSPNGPKWRAVCGARPGI